MRKRVLMASEKLAEYAIGRGFDSAADAAAGFAATLLDGFYDGNPDIVLSFEQEGLLQKILLEFIEDNLVEKADELIEDWTRESREERRDREEARAGRY